MGLKTKDMILIGIFTALMVVGAFISVPTPFGIKVTFQLFFAIMAGLILGAKRGGLSQLIYILLGLTGVPVFSEGGGIFYFAKATFGFLLGFILVSLIIGYYADRSKGYLSMPLYGKICIGVFAVLVDYVLGVAYFWLIARTVMGTPMSIIQISQIMATFFVKDIILMIVALGLAKVIIPQLNKAHLLPA